MTIPRGLIGAVVFDLDGVLFDTERLYKRASKLALVELSVDIDDELLDSLVGLSDADCDSLLVGQYGEHAFADYLWRYRQHRDRLLASGIPLRRGASHLIQTLSRRRVPMAVATSAARATADKYLADSGLRGSMSAVITGEDAGASKPAPDLYLAAASALSLPATSCVAVEDSRAGILAAHSAGLWVVGVPDIVRLDQAASERCLKVCEDLNSVLPVLEELLEPRFSTKQTREPQKLACSDRDIHGA